MTRTLTMLLAVACLCSCSATYDEKIAAVHHAYYLGDLPAARQSMRVLLEDSELGDSYHTCLLLDDAIVSLVSGAAAKARETLRQVRDELDRVEEAELKAVLGEMKTYFTDDRSKDYPGEDYEKLMVRVMLAFADLLEGGEDVIAYANQVLDKQQQILDQDAPDRSGKKYKSGYRKVGIGSYIYGMVTEERDPSAGSEAAIAYRRVKEWEPQFAAIDGDIERASEGSFASQGNGVVYVYGFVGKGPQKIEVVESDLTAASEIALQFTRFIPEVGKYYGATLDLSPLKVPLVRRNASNSIESLAIAVDGASSGSTQTLTDVSGTAVQHYNVNKAWIVGKAIARRMVKKAIVTAAKGTGRMVAEKNSNRNDRALIGAAFEIGGILANTLWSAAERADTRQWSLLPDTIQVLRVELPEGDHDIAITPRLKGGGAGATRTTRVSVLAGYATYVLAFVPTPGPGPSLLSTRQAASAQPAAGEISAVAP